MSSLAQSLAVLSGLARAGGFGTSGMLFYCADGPHGFSCPFIVSPHIDPVQALGVDRQMYPSYFAFTGWFNNGS